MSTEPVALPSPEQAEEARNALRRPVMLRAKLRDRASSRFDIEVTNLSCSGFLAETIYRLNPQDRVWLTIPGFAALEAVVARTAGRAYGCAFAQPLHPAVFDHIIAMSHHA
jgi:hypothetical protein